MTKVLHVLDHSLPIHSGYTFRTRAILKAQKADGLQLRGITGLRHELDGPSPQETDGLTFNRTAGKLASKPGLREWQEISALSESIVGLAQTWKPDILHAHSPALCGLAAMRAARKLDIPLVYEIRAFWEDAAVGNRSGREGSLKYRLTRAMENRVVEGAGAVFTICHGLRDDLIARGFPPQKIGIMPNGVDLELFGQPPARDTRLAAELGLNGGDVMGFIGSFYDYEGLDVLIAAMPALLERRPNAHLLLVGGGPMEQELREQAAASPASHAVHFAGRVPHEQVERYYSLCDVMVYPRKASRLTDLVTPLKPLEAMAQRTIVAASSVGGHRELIADGETGCLFDPDDAEACAVALAALFARRDTWDAMRDRARAHITRKHDWACNARRYQDVYQALLAAKGSRGFSAAA